MPIYEASFLGEPKPIRKQQDDSSKPPRKRKQKAPPSDASLLDLELDKTLEDNIPIPPVKKSRKKNPTPPTVPPPVTTTAPVKKPRQQKKKVQEPTPSTTSEEQQPLPPVKKPRKKAAPKLNESLPTTSEKSEIEEVPSIQKAMPKERRARAPKKIIIQEGIETTDEPPLWFKKWHEDERKRKAKGSNEKVSAQVLRQEAHTTANSQWQNGHTRDRVMNEVDGHMGRLYKMIHSRSY